MRSYRLRAPVQRGEILSKLEDWLGPRLTDVPESLRGVILDAVEGGRAEGRKGGRFVERLQSAGERLMLDAKSASPTRDSAMTLLAADALITFACEAAAEAKPEKLGDL